MIRNGEAVTRKPLGGSGVSPLNQSRDGSATPLPPDGYALTKCPDCGRPRVRCICGNSED